MAEKFDIHARILGDLTEAHRLLSLTSKTLNFDAVKWSKGREAIATAITILESMPMPKIMGERTEAIARRMGTTYRMVIQLINRRRAKGHKIKELWRDKRGLIFPPGLFQGEKIKHRRRRKAASQRAFKRASKRGPT